MSVAQLKLICYLTLTASGILAIVLLLSDAPMPIKFGAALCLWGCGLVNGMTWQFMIDHETQPQGESSSK